MKIDKVYAFSLDFLKNHVLIVGRQSGEIVNNTLISVASRLGKAYRAFDNGGQLRTFRSSIAIKPIWGRNKERFIKNRLILKRVLKRFKTFYFKRNLKRTFL